MIIGEEYRITVELHRAHSEDPLEEKDLIMSQLALCERIHWLLVDVP